MKPTLAILAALWLAYQARGSTWYLTQDGAGIRDGISVSSAWAVGAETWGKHGIEPGDTVYLSGLITSQWKLRGGGTPGNPITILANKETQVAGISAKSKNFIEVIGVPFFQGSLFFSLSAAVSMENCSNWLIQDCSFTSLNCTGVNLAYNTHNTNNIIRHCTFQDLGTQSALPGSIELYPCVEVHGDNNLVEYNTMGRCDHYVYVFGKNDIVRNNFFGPMLESDFGSTSISIPGAGSLLAESPSVSSGGAGYYLGDVLGVDQPWRQYLGKNSPAGTALVVVTSIAGGGTGPGPVSSVTLQYAGTNYVATIRAYSPKTVCTTTDFTHQAASGCQLDIYAATGDPHVDNLHTDYISTGTADQFNHVDFEANFSAQGSNTINGHGAVAEDTADPLPTTPRISNLIERFNVASHLGNLFQIFINLDNIRTYNNTDDNAEASGGMDFVGYSDYGVSIEADVMSLSGLYFNNIFSNQQGATNGFTSIAVSNMNGGTFTLFEGYEDVFGGGAATDGSLGPNLKLDPGFNNGVNLDYTLASGSPMINAGIANIRDGPGMTTATNSGELSIQLTVADPYGIVDGYGIADGDWITIGSNPPVQVASNPYSGTITLASAQTWSRGSPVNVVGTQDMGALPSEYVPTGAVSATITNTSPPITAAGTYALSALLSSSTMVRKVDFLLDGVPINGAPVYIAIGGSRSVTLPGYAYDGLAHTIEIRAYNRWASTTPAVSVFMYLPTPIPDLPDVERGPR